ncbi:Phosphoribosylglycinamide synthetase, ATP-grasp (A) domain protein [Alkalibacterium sp. AK22]|uniref:ATP-grasp domain-containing protein n=1 Tax=Alkalibacterium sp. AK22 TaxID=1229520 RepID=UPI000445FE80|nr:ATP-grasp domain-containing protein [Alkalibacterium sp. AK22]EXJ23325.1 Phosphoribosylglycinamide synthetase, ATP-grasp (A) domain protein [Alkalibacterium sp. AK22]
MKKILLLGGSTQQIPAIEYANKKGYYTVLCDYLPDNPGQHVAKVFYCVSTTDKEAILKVAKKEKVDGIVAYASDPAAPTAAYVAEQLGLPTNPFSSVEILTFKDKFRTFLKENHFNCPKAQSYTSFEQAKQDIENFNFPVMVKPIDSSGSKGVSKVLKLEDFEQAFEIALEHSRSQHIIVEEFIVQDHPYMIAGDCFVVDGQVTYWGLLNSHRHKGANPYVPIGTSYPIYISEDRFNLVKKETQKLFDCLNIKFGAFNVEIMIDQNEQLYFVEMGPRNGGNMIPDLLFMATGEDMIAATIESALGQGYTFSQDKPHKTFISTYVLHTEQTGRLLDIKYKEGIEGKILKKILYKKNGELVQRFYGSNKALGIVFLNFNNQQEQMDFVTKPEQWIEVIVE